MNSTNLFKRFFVYLKAVYGNPQAQYDIAGLISQSQLPNAKDSALKWYQLAADQGHPQACYDYALYHINQVNQVDKAINILQNAASSTHAELHALLGQLLLNKYTTIIDHRKFIDQNDIKNRFGNDEVGTYMASLVASANPPSAIDLTITDQDLNNYKVDAVKHLKIGQDLNHPLAFHALAVFLLQYDDSKDKTQILENQTHALELLKKAVSINFAPSCQVLAGIYENGKFGTTQDIEAGLKLRIQAANSGSKDAIFVLGSLIYKGQGFEANKEEGLKLIQKAANQGHIEAQAFLLSTQKNNT